MLNSNGNPRFRAWETHSYHPALPRNPNSSSTRLTTAQELQMLWTNLPQWPPLLIYPTLRMPRPPAGGSNVMSPPLKPPAFGDRQDSQMSAESELLESLSRQNSEASENPLAPVRVSQFQVEKILGIKDDKPVDTPRQVGDSNFSQMPLGGNAMQSPQDNRVAPFGEHQLHVGDKREWWVWRHRGREDCTFECRRQARFSLSGTVSNACWTLGQSGFSSLESRKDNSQGDKGWQDSGEGGGGEVGFRLSYFQRLLRGRIEYRTHCCAGLVSPEFGNLET